MRGSKKEEEEKKKCSKVGLLIDAKIFIRSRLYNILRITLVSE